jgi:hypothetical protein
VTGRAGLVKFDANYHHHTATCWSSLTAIGSHPSTAASHPALDANNQPSGNTALDPATYHDVQMIHGSNGTIRIVPG